MGHLGSEPILALVSSVSGGPRSTLLHLLGCPPCRRRAVELATLEEIAETEEAPEAAALAESGISRLWERVAQVERRWDLEIGKDQEAAHALFRELMARSFPRDALQENRFHSPTVAGLLVVASERESAPPARASLAALALAIAEKVDPQRFPEGLVVDLKVRAGCALAEAERLRFDREGARKALRRVAEEVEILPLDAGERGLYCYALALYHKSLGQTEEALALLSRADLLFENLERFQELGQARLEEGWLRLEEGEAETAEAVLLEALNLLEPEQNPGKALRAHYGLALCLAEQGKSVEALRRAREARRLHSLLPCGLARQQARVWEAEVAARCGRNRRAAETLRSVLEELLAGGACAEAATVALHLLDLYERMGKPREMESFCRAFDPAVRFRRLPPRSALLLSVAFGVTRGKDSSAPLVRERAAHLLQILQYQPDLPLPRGASATTLAWEEMQMDLRQGFCSRVRMDERLAAKGSCEIEPEQAEVLAWAVELVAGVRLVFTAASAEAALSQSEAWETVP